MCVNKIIPSLINGKTIFIPTNSSWCFLSFLVCFRNTPWFRAKSWYWVCKRSSSCLCWSFWRLPICSECCLLTQNHNRQSRFVGNGLIESMSKHNRQWTSIEQTSAVTQRKAHSQQIKVTKCALQLLYDIDCYYSRLCWSVQQYHIEIIAQSATKDNRSTQRLHEF